MTTARPEHVGGPPGDTVPDHAARTRKRRRPTGAPPALPRHIGVTGKSWLALLAVLLVWIVVAALSFETRRFTDRGDAAVLRFIARIRSDPLTDVMDAIERLGAGYAMTVAGVGLLVAMMVFRRWRHLFTFLISVLLTELAGQAIYNGFARPRPYDVTILGRWAGFSLPAPPVAVLTLVVVGVLYTMVVPGRPRNLAKGLAAVVLATYAFAEIYLANYHPFDVVVGIALSVAISVNAFRFFTPNEVFPVRYSSGKKAHLDVGGRRGEAIREAVSDQLGLIVTDIDPVGLAGSGGSTPLRLTIDGDPPVCVFGKLYAMSHVRADRWYKLGRTLLYGRLEDEAPFQSVRRLAQHEDHAARLLRDIGIPTAEPHGIVELTPEREYLLVTEFFDGAEEIGEAEVDDSIIDQGLQLIRRLWDAGLAHRDIKPANLLVRDGRLLLIDVAFVQVRPTPWREAVDLANMMLVLAVRTDAPRVYERALRFFTPDEIAEAFAAARGIASPSQLKTVMRQDGRDLLAEFRELAPERRPISLQRWGPRRVALLVVVLVAGLIGVQTSVDLFTPAHDLELEGMPNCGTQNLMILSAQAVPSAAMVPCIAALPAGWEFGGVRIGRNRATFWLDSDAGGDRAVQAVLRPRDECDVEGAVPVPTDEVGTQRFERAERLPPLLATTRIYLFRGGCITYRFELDGPATGALMFAADSALSFQPRQELVEEVRRRSGGLRLCGAGAPCPE